MTESAKRGMSIFLFVFSSLLLRAMGIYLLAMLIMSYALWFVGSHFSNGGRENLFSDIPFWSHWLM